MNRFGVAAGVLLSWRLSSGAFAQGAGDEPWWRDEPLPDGPVVLERMRAALPTGVVEMRGLLMPRGVAARAGERSFHASLALDWHGMPSRAAFEIRDSETGEFAAGFLIERRPGEPPVYRRVEGDGSLTEAGPDERVWTTVFHWRDLAFDYLWWPGAVTSGIAMRSQRRCFLVDVTNPDPDSEEVRVRLWVDDATYAPLQVQTLDADGKPLRELSVKSLRRVGLQWTVEDLEVRDLRTGRRTLLRILPPEDS